MSTLPDRHEFEEFFERVEPKLRTALIAVFGQETGRDAAAAALAYGWEHWDRISSMGNPVGYLYRVGRSSQRRHKEPMWVEAPQVHTPHFEPGLPTAIAALSEKQRLAVVLVHAYGWDRRETADIVGISVSSIDTHLSRGLSRLRKSLGVETNA
jgi:RNA polymerase sigma-70 factor (ECF subfamily)